MFLAAPATAFVAALCVLSVTAQNNYVDDGNFDYAEPSPRAAPRPAPSYRPNTLSNAPKPTPVPILKQINRHNEDGSYTYGYEGADGSFKIETKLANGEVMGKYGYVDDNGKVRVVEYGANKYGFQPAGEGITVAPPTLVDETATKRPKQQPGQGRLVENTEPEYDDGQYYEEAPRAALAPTPRRPATRPASRPAPVPHAAPQPQYTPQAAHQSQYTPQSAPQSQYTPQAAPQSQFSPQDTYSSFSSSQTFGPSRPVSAGPVPARIAVPGASSVGPAPPRASIPGAAPVGPSPSFSQARSLPPSQPAYRPPQPQSYFAPAPVYEPRPAPSRPAPSRASYGRSGGILDQLEKDFALPSNSAPALHDITFGSY